MNRSFFARCGALVIVGMAASACTMKSQERPDLTGPSEFATSVDISVSPDVLKQDGADQSTITVRVRDEKGGPKPRVNLRAEISVGGVVANFGKLSAKSLTTDSSGTARLVYTAPLGAPFVTEESTIVNLDVTPQEGDFSNSSTRSASLRLVATGIVVPPFVPGELRAAFTSSPSSPNTIDQTILFDASSSTAPASYPITRYAWDFGDGETGSGRTATHSYDESGTFVVRLTVSDDFGHSASAAAEVTVAAATPATPRFTFSPTAPAPRQQVNFNASQSTPGPNRRIVSYAWDFGDGSPLGSGMLTNHVYAGEGTFTVTLTITDDNGRKYSTSSTVPVKAPTP
jgi:PKD repeat protein